MSASSLNLIWCDLEFTHLDLDRTRILQAAMLVTTPELVPVAPPAASSGSPVPGGDGPLAGAAGSLEGLNFLVRLTADEAALASDWVQANQGELLTRCQEDPAALPVAEVERRMLTYLREACGVEQPDPSPRSRPLLAGNTVHKDYTVLERFMPTLVDNLSYRLVDVSGIKELRRRWYPEVPDFDKATQAREYLPDLSLEGSEHDALYDIKCSLAELRYYRERLFR